MSNQTLSRRLAAETVGTSMLVAAVVGSGIMAERLSGGNIGVALLANTIATGAALTALILVFAPVSGAHFNPIVSLASALGGELSWRDSGLYTISQIAGGVAGTAAANLMFELAPLTVATKVRTGMGQWLGEFIAAAGLIGVILAVSRQHRTAQSTAAAVAGFIMAAYWFTSSTSFANPAVTIARSLTDTFTGISPANVPAFIGAQIAGCLAAAYFFNWLVPKRD